MIVDVGADELLSAADAEVVVAAKRACEYYEADLFHLQRKALDVFCRDRHDPDRVAAAAEIKVDVLGRAEQVIYVPVKIDLPFVIDRHVNPLAKHIQRPAVKLFPFAIVHDDNCVSCVKYRITDDTTIVAVCQAIVRREAK